MILVAGGTGNLGSRLVAGLVAKGVPVRVLTRDPARAAQMLGPDVEAVRGDVRDPSTLAAALKGAATVVSAVHGFAAPQSPASVDERGNANLVEAASRAGAGVVLMSVVGASGAHPMELFRAKHRAEQNLQASGIPWSIVRATAFAETWAGIMAAPLKASGTIPVFGRGDNPINFVSVTDVAALLERVVLDPGLRSRTLELGGPDNVTFNQFASILQDVTGRTGKVRHIPRPALRVMGVLTAVPKPALARQARAAIAMDTLDMIFDPTPIRRAFPDLPVTDVATALKALLA